MHFNERELATILAALRFWQRKGNMAGPEWVIASAGGRPLEYKGIDDLCERLKAGEIGRRLLERMRMAGRK